MKTNQHRPLTDQEFTVLAQAIRNDPHRRAPLMYQAALLSGGLAGGAPDDPPKDPPADPPKPAPAPSGGGIDWQERARTAEAKNRERDEKDRETRSAAKKEKDEQDRVAKEKAGEWDSLKTDYEGKFKNQEDELKGYREQTVARVKGKVEKLSKEAKAEVDLIRDSMPADKFEAFVDLKPGGAKDDPKDKKGKKAPPPAPAPGTGGANRTPQDGHQLNADTLELLKRVPTLWSGGAQETGKLLGHFTIDGTPNEDGEIIGNTGDQKFRFQGTGDDLEDIHSFIRLNNAIAVDPMRDKRDQARKRIRENLGVA